MYAISDIHKLFLFFDQMNVYNIEIMKNYLHKPSYLLYNTTMNLTSDEQTKTWIVGVSGGGDSMALLHMCYEAHMKIIVAHMNYQKRESANRDMEGVRAYCQKRGIVVEVRMQEEVCDENFQAFARKKRYEFYHDLIEKYHAYGVLVAHQLDDYLETYLIQKQRHMIPHVYGLSDHVDIFGCHVVRPLLSYTKQELEEYCKKHGVSYWLDESNLSDAYTRNKLRHTQIDPLSYEEKQCLKQKITKENEDLQCLHNQVRVFLNQWDQSCHALLAQKEQLIKMILYTWILCNTGCTISHKEQTTLCSLIKQANNWTRQVSSAYDIRKDYDQLSILKHTDDTFAYVYPSLIYEATPYFTIQEHGTMIEGVSLTEDDFPITIRSYQAGDFIQLRFGKKKLNRWFIDRKIPLEERKKWPVMVNAQGNIIFVSKIGCDIAHFSNNPNAFVIK